MNKNIKTGTFPKTRYQGSKYKLSNWIWENIKDLKFDTVLDVFGGTGSVSYMLKQNGKQVIYNDILKFNYIIGKALIENNHVLINEEDIEYILTKRDILYPTFIEDNFYIDLVYIDSPYISSKGVGMDYIDFYHLLEGIMNYDNWSKMIISKYKHKPLKGRCENTWIKKNRLC